MCIRPGYGKESQQFGKDSHMFLKSNLNGEDFLLNNNNKVFSQYVSLKLL